MAGLNWTLKVASRLTHTHRPTKHGLCPTGPASRGGSRERLVGTRDQIHEVRRVRRGVEGKGREEGECGQRAAACASWCVCGGCLAAFKLTGPLPPRTHAHTLTHPSPSPTPLPTPQQFIVSEPAARTNHCSFHQRLPQLPPSPAAACFPPGTANDQCHHYQADPCGGQPCRDRGI